MLPPAFARGAAPELAGTVLSPFPSCFSAYNFPDDNFVRSTAAHRRHARGVLGFATDVNGVAVRIGERVGGVGRSCAGAGKQGRCVAHAVVPGMRDEESGGQKLRRRGDQFQLILADTGPPSPWPL